MNVPSSELSPAPDEFQATVGALREALTDMESGDVGTPLAEFDRDFRARHRVPPNELI